jgi:hypothetical protein
MITVGNTTTFSGVFGTSTGTGTSTGLTVAGAGRLVLSGASPNTFAEAVTVGDGVVSGTILEAAKTGALAANTGVTINTGGTLLLSGGGGTDNRINTAAAFNLAGGKLDLSGMTTSIDQKVGALTLSANSIIDFGTLAGGNTFRFATGLGDWTGLTLSIYNWTAGIDHLYFGTDPSGLAASRLPQISFFTDAGMTLANGFTGAEFNGVPFDGVNGEISPVPEPSSVIAAMGLLGIAGWRERRAASVSRRKMQA